MTGEKGRMLQERVWGEIVEGLGKDVPEVRELAKL